MAKSNVVTLASVRASAAELVARSKSQVLRDVWAVRKDIQRRADKTVRVLERKIVKQLHAASESRVRRLEARVARLEKTIAEVGRRTAAS